MEIVLHDFSGHPFQAELSRRIAAEGHVVRHVSARQYVSGKGHLDRIDGDHQGLSFHEIERHLPFEKYAPLGVCAGSWPMGGLGWVTPARCDLEDIATRLVAVLEDTRASARA